MDDNTPVLSASSQPNIVSELERIKHELQTAEGKIMKLELELLQSRDFAIGAAAAAGESPVFRIRAMYVESERQLGDANAHIKSHLAHIQRLEQVLKDQPIIDKSNKELRVQIENLQNSATWRIGRLIMLPIRILKRFVN